MTGQPRVERPMNLDRNPAQHAEDAARRRSIAFLNWAHAIDHFVLLIYPTVVIGLEVIYRRPYSELIALSSAAFRRLRRFSLPAGWLADRWSRRNMMAAFYFGCGVSLALTAFAPNLTDAGGRHVRARHVRRDLSPGRHGDADRGLRRARAHARLQRRVRQSRRFAWPPASAPRLPPGSAGAPRFWRPRGALRHHRRGLSLADAGRPPSRQASANRSRQCR